MRILAGIYRNIQEAFPVTFCMWYWYENRTKVPAWTRSNRLAALDSSCIETTHQTLVEDWGRPKTDTIQYPITFMWSTNRWQPMGDAQTWWCPFGEPQFLSATSMSLDHWITLNVQLALDSWRLQCWCVLLGQTFCMLARWGFHLWELLRWLYCPGLPRSSCQFWRLSFRNSFCSTLTSIFTVLRCYTQIVSHATYGIWEVSAPKTTVWCGL